MKDYTFIFFILFLFILPGDHSAAAFATDSTKTRRWYTPHYVPLQFAGNIGLFSTGMGYTSNKGNYQLGILYGWVPATVAQSHIHTVTAKNFFPLFYHPLKNHQILVPYIGLGLSLEIGGNAFLKLPSHYPKGYYDFPKSVHVIAFGGLKVQHLFENDIKFLRGMELFAEAGTLDLYIWYKTISDEIKFNQIFSLALGVNLMLNH